jgi:SNF2 family DNA or RNA helicase
LQVIPDVVEEMRSGQFGDAEDFKRKLSTGLIIGENNRTGAFLRSSTQPLPHQAFVVHKLFSHNRFGHILADDVGLGKTIEAGLIVASFLKPSSDQRVLVVCPTGLALQWQDEMADHFNLFFAIMGIDFNGRWIALKERNTEPFFPVSEPLISSYAMRRID